MESKVGMAFNTIPTDGCYRRARSERLLGENSGEQLTHPGLAGFPTVYTLHPGGNGCDVARWRYAETGAGSGREE